MACLSYCAEKCSAWHRYWETKFRRSIILMPLRIVYCQHLETSRRYTVLQMQHTLQRWTLKCENKLACIGGLQCQDHKCIAHGMIMWKIRKPSNRILPTYNASPFVTSQIVNREVLAKRNSKARTCRIIVSGNICRSHIFWKAQTSVFQHYQTGCLTTMVVSFYLGFDFNQLFCLGVQVQLNILCRWMWKQQNLRFFMQLTVHRSWLSASPVATLANCTCTISTPTPRWQAAHEVSGTGRHVLGCAFFVATNGSDMQVFIPKQTKHCLLSNRWRSDDSFS